MQPEIRLKYKWIKQIRKDVLLFLEENYGVGEIITSKESIEDDLGITGDDAYEMTQKFEEVFLVDMSSLNFTEYFQTESELDVFPPLFVILLLKLFLFPFAILIFPFSRSASKEMLLFNPFIVTNSRKKKLTVGDLITSSLHINFHYKKKSL